MQVEHYSTVRPEHNRYSVPTEYAGLKVTVEIGVDKVHTFHNHRRIAEHSRIFVKNK